MILPSFATAARYCPELELAIEFQSAYGADVAVQTAVDREDEI